MGLTTRSAPHVLENNCAEFDEKPMRVQFTNPQGMVRVYVGNRERSEAKAVMRAYDALTGGRLVAQSEVTVGALASVTVPLEVCRALERDIRRIEITVSDAGCEIIDDLMWDPAPELDAVTTVNFDDRADGTRITTQYPGLNFPDQPWIRAAAFLTTRTREATLNVNPHSSPNVLEQYSFGMEFDASPLVVQLTRPQGWVRVRVGPRTIDRNIRITLQAYNTDDERALPVATASADFSPALTSPTTTFPITVPLEVCRLLDRDIRRVKIQSSVPEFEVIDDFQFAGTAPPRPSLDREAPRAFIDSPRPTDCLPRDAIVLTGRINDAGDLERAILIQEQLDGTGRAEHDLLASHAVTGTAPNFSVRSNVTLFPGRNRFRIEATDTSGNRATNPEREVTVIVAPPMQIFIDTPRDGFVTSRSPLTVEGRVSKPCGASPSVRVQVSTVVDGRTIPFAPVDSVSGAAPDFRFRANVNLLSNQVESFNTITVEAISEDGQRRPASVSVDYSLPDVSLLGLEVTQATELLRGIGLNESSFMPLVSGKSTVVRIYPAAARWRGGGSLRLPRVQLFGRRDGHDLPGSPITMATEKLARPITVPELRNDKNATWNVLLPDVWTSEGEVELVARINVTHALQECDTCYANDDFRRTRIRFRPPTTLRIVPVIVDRGDGTSVTPTSFSTLFEGIRRAYPITTLDLRPAMRLRTGATDEDLFDLIADEYTCYDDDFFGSIWDWIQDCDWDTYYVGVLSTSDGCYGGLAGLNSPVCWSDQSPWTIAQEVAHCLERDHARGFHNVGRLYLLAAIRQRREIWRVGLTRKRSAGTSLAIARIPASS